MWYLTNISCNYVYHYLEGSLCFEYCNEYTDEEGNKVYVPDSLYEEFLKNNNVDED